MGLDLTPATALTQVIVSASAVASCIYGVCSRSPTAPERSLIDWDLTVFMPALLVGVSVGQPSSSLPYTGETDAANSVACAEMRFSPLSRCPVQRHLPKMGADHSIDCTSHSGICQNPWKGP